MNIYEIIKKRKSVREYKDKEVEEDKLKRILEAARLAPSASNRQEWRFVVVRDRRTREELAKAANEQMFIASAPVVLVCCAETDNHVMRCGQLCYPINLAIIIDHITLTAVEEGLGTCWIGAFYEDKVRKLLNIPENVRIVELLCLGYPENDSLKIKNRLSLGETVKWEKWK